MVIAIVLAALLGMQRFLKASLMGRWGSIADSYGFGRQYEPGKTTVGQ
jgi:hypothetical protein